MPISFPIQPLAELPKTPILDTEHTHLPHIPAASKRVPKCCGLRFVRSPASVRRQFEGKVDIFGTCVSFRE